MPRRQDLRLKMVYAALLHVPQTGWTDAVLKLAAQDLGEPESMGWRLFPNGIDQVIQLWNDDLDKKMVSRLKRYKLENKRVRDKVALAIRLRLDEMAPCKAAVVETAKYLALPHHTPLGSKMLFKTVDEMWYQAGDRSKDHNWYTKRGLLSGVYVSTLLYWMKDTSKDYADTWEFLDHRIDNVMKLGVLPKQLVECCQGLPKKISEVFKALRP